MTSPVAVQVVPDEDDAEVQPVASATVGVVGWMAEVAGWTGGGRRPCYSRRPLAIAGTLGSVKPPSLSDLVM